MTPLFSLEVHCHLLYETRLQVIGVNAQDIEHVQALFMSEPISRNGGIQNWLVFESDQLSHENLTNDCYSPYLCVFSANQALTLTTEMVHAANSAAGGVGIGVSSNGGELILPPIKQSIETKSIFELESEPLRTHIRHHKRHVGRVWGYNLLYYPKNTNDISPSKASDQEPFVPLDNEEAADPPENIRGNEVGVMLCFNARSNADARRYLEADPLLNTVNCKLKVSFHIF